MLLLHIHVFIILSLKYNLQKTVKKHSIKGVKFCTHPGIMSFFATQHWFLELNQWDYYMSIWLGISSLLDQFQHLELSSHALSILDIISNFTRDLTFDAHEKWIWSPTTIDFWINSFLDFFTGMGYSRLLPYFFIPICPW